MVTIKVMYTGEHHSAMVHAYLLHGKWLVLDQSNFTVCYRGITIIVVWCFLHAATFFFRVHHLSTLQLLASIGHISQPSRLLPSGPNFIKPESTKICLVWNFFSDKNKITNQILVCCILLVTGIRLLFAYPENHMEIWLVILFLLRKKFHGKQIFVLTGFMKYIYWFIS